jgi:hypothetical protein
MNMLYAMAYIEDRFAEYGIPLKEGLKLIHPYVWENATPAELYRHIQGHRIRHIKSCELYPELANDISNCFLESELSNTAQQERQANQFEIDVAWKAQKTFFLDQDYADIEEPHIYETPLFNVFAESSTLFEAEFLALM